MTINYKFEESGTWHSCKVVYDFCLNHDNIIPWLKCCGSTESGSMKNRFTITKNNINNNNNNITGPNCPIKNICNQTVEKLIKIKHFMPLASKL